MSTCKNIFQKVFKFNQIIFIIQYRNVQYQVPRCPVSSTEMSSNEYRDVAYIQYRDVLIPYGKAMSNVGDGPPKNPPKIKLFFLSKFIYLFIHFFY